MYEFTGEFEITYYNVIIPGEGSLVATPGRRVDFAALEMEPPVDGRWAEVAPPELKTKKTKTGEES